MFDGPTALASHLGVSTGAVCNAAREAKQKEQSVFYIGGHCVSRREMPMDWMPGRSLESSSKNHPSAAVDPESLYTLTSFTQVHAHLQAAALRCYPGRKLLVPARGPYQHHSIRTWSSKDFPEPKFDLAQVWSLHSPSSYCASYGFRRALLGEPQETPTPELDPGKYPSVLILKYSEKAYSEKSKWTVAMNAEDILKFMLSDFARKGAFDEIFDDEKDWTGPPELVSLMQGAAPAAPQTAAPQTAAPQTAAPSQTAQPLSPRHAFASICLDRMRELEQHFRESAELCHKREQQEGDAHGAASKRRKLAHAAMGSITKVLFDANMLVLDAMLEPGGTR